MPTFGTNISLNVFIGKIVNKYFFPSFDVTRDAMQNQIQTLSVPYLVVVEDYFAVLRPLLGWFCFSNFPSCLLMGDFSVNGRDLVFNILTNLLGLSVLLDSFNSNNVCLYVASHADKPVQGLSYL
jgi:hypothetical protein